MTSSPSQILRTFLTLDVMICKSAMPGTGLSSGSGNLDEVVVVLVADM